MIYTYATSTRIRGGAPRAPAPARTKLNEIYRAKSKHFVVV